MTKTICSVYFSKLVEIRRPSYQGVFNVPVVKKGDPPAMLIIKDHYEVNELPFFAGTVGNRPIKKRETILGEQIAEDVLAHWTKYHPEMSPQCAPGLWVMRDIVYLWDDEERPMIDAEGKQEYRPATDEEKRVMFEQDLAAAHERQDAWVEMALVKGDIMSEKPAAVPFIPQYCRDSVDYSGQERTWRKGLKSGDIKNCPYCTKAIASRSFKCPYCSEIVDAAGYAEFKSRQEEAQRQANARIKAERDADKLREENIRLRAERLAEGKRLHEENKRLAAERQSQEWLDAGDNLVAAAEARAAKIAAEREAEEAALAGAEK